jgi:hypothetical protein
MGARSGILQMQVQTRRDVHDSHIGDIRSTCCPVGSLLTAASVYTVCAIPSPPTITLPC